MIPKSVLFYWSKGAEVRRSIIKFIHESNLQNKPCFLNILSTTFKMSHTGMKKHIDLLTEEGFVILINPGGKPVYLKLTEKGQNILKELGIIL